MLAKHPIAVGSLSVLTFYLVVAGGILVGVGPLASNAFALASQAKTLQFLRPTDVPYSSGWKFISGSSKASKAGKLLKAVSNPKHAIDNSVSTFALLSGERIEGKRLEAISSKTMAPVQGYMIFDLGRPCFLTGMTINIQTYQEQLRYNAAQDPPSIDVYYFTDDQPSNHAVADDIEGDPGIEPLYQHRLAPISWSQRPQSSYYWNGVVARYVGVRFNSRYEEWDGYKTLPHCQIKEVCFVGYQVPKKASFSQIQKPLYKKTTPLPLAMLAMRKRYQEVIGSFSGSDSEETEKEQAQIASLIGNQMWENLRHDFPARTYPFLDQVHYGWFDLKKGWLVEGDSTKFEQAFVSRFLNAVDACAAKLKSSQASLAVKRFHIEFNSLKKAKVSGSDSRWLQLCMKLANITSMLESLGQLQQAVAELSEAYPGRYPESKLQTRINVLAFNVMSLGLNVSDPGNTAWKRLRAQIVELKRLALVDENPLLKGQKILFAKRHAYCSSWYYADFTYASQFGGNLYLFSLDSGETKELVTQLDGGIFDRFDLAFDGLRVVFGYKKGLGHGFRLYEVGIDGSGLRQITVDPPDEASRIARYRLPYARSYQHHTDDFHPCYLPDGGICFTSTRCERGVLCADTDHLTVNTLYRVNGDGTNMQPLSEGALSESSPSMLNDGRILYTRWEYVDKGAIGVQSLWAMRPDGSGSVEMFGGQHEFPPVSIHARAIPDKSHLFVATSTMHHPFAVGPIHLINTRYPLLTTKPLTSLTPDTSLWLLGTGGFPSGEKFSHKKNGRWVGDNCGPLFADPYPLTDPATGECSASFFLVTCNPDRPWNDRKAYGLYLIDKFGNRVPLYSDPDISCWQPIPVMPRAVPPVLPSLIEDPEYRNEAACDTSSLISASSKNNATVAVSNIYAGLTGVELGTVKYLRIWEQVPRPWSARRFWPDDSTGGQHAVVSLNAHLYVKVLHGVVPVDEDGSIYFTIPADKNLFFEALDKDFMEVQRMRTFVNFQPGEKRACVGCHLTAHTAPSNHSTTAFTRPPVSPAPQPDETAPRPIHYVTDVQPVFDRHCVECHNTKRAEGNLDLSGTLTTYFNRSYEQIMTQKQVGYVQELYGPQARAQKHNVASLPPYSLGSHASRLISVLRKNHYNVQLTQSEWLKLVTWIDANAPYYGSYFGRRNLKYRDHPDFRPVPTLESAQGNDTEHHTQIQ